ncbi:hypothetical protein GGR53DRAFT_462026 [Hypoxylon sp. FL1150]|nr:hypothetical protein GGR53DRAFT_462026 [Hypoxylon sp. FL1150]
MADVEERLWVWVQEAAIEEEAQGRLYFMEKCLCSKPAMRRMKIFLKFHPQEKLDKIVSEVVSYLDVSTSAPPTAYDDHSVTESQIATGPSSSNRIHSSFIHPDSPRASTEGMEAPSTQQVAFPASSKQLNIRRPTQYHPTKANISAPKLDTADILHHPERISESHSTVKSPDSARHNVQTAHSPMFYSVPTTPQTPNSTMPAPVLKGFSSLISWNDILKEINFRTYVHEYLNTESGRNIDIGGMEEGNAKEMKIDEDEEAGYPDAEGAAERIEL